MSIRMEESRDRKRGWKVNHKMIWNHLKGREGYRLNIIPAEY